MNMSNALCKSSFNRISMGSELGLYRMSNLSDAGYTGCCLPDSGTGFLILVNYMYCIVELCPSYDAGLCQNG